MPLVQKLVPLSEVSEHTDDVLVGGLNLPEDFDTDSLSLSLPALKKIMRWGNVGHLTLLGYKGAVSGVGLTGEAEIEDTTVFPTWERYPWGYNWGKAFVNVNAAEIECRIVNDGDMWDDGVNDSAAQAHYMNLALRTGLRKASKELVVPTGTQPSQSIARAGFTVLYFAMLRYGLPPEMGDGLRLAIASGSVPISGLVEAGGNHLASRYKYRNREDLPDRKWSILNFPQYDRLLATTALLQSAELIQVTES